MKEKEEDLKTVEFILKDETEKEIGSIDIISIVQNPATEVNFQMFSKGQKTECKFSEEGSEKQEITGLIMRANKKILRQDKNENFYYCIFSPSTVRQSAQLYFKHKNNTKTNLEHSNYEISNKIYLFESWVVRDPKDSEANALGFKDIQKDDWWGTFKVEDKALWDFLKQHYKNGGFSLEGIFSINEDLFEQNEMSDEHLYSIVKEIISDETTPDEIKHTQIKGLLFS